MGPSPRSVDWDEDGDYDLISGEYYGYVTLFRNIGSETDPVLTDEGHVLAGGSDLNVGSLSTPDVVDWNEDGAKDLVVGCDSGYIYLFFNIGTNEAPEFDDGRKIIADGGFILQIKNYPRIVDLNGDGLKDIVMGWYSGSCLFWPNYGSEGVPVFYENYELTGYSDLIDPEPADANWSHLDVADWDADGNPDLLYTRWESEVFIHVNGTVKLSVSADPIDAPIVIPEEGGNLRCRLTAENSSVSDAIVDGWIEGVLPSGDLYGPVSMKNDITIQGASSGSMTVSQYVPGAAPSGKYTYTVCLGKEGNGCFVSGSFEFEKE